MWTPILKMKEAITSVFSFIKIDKTVYPMVQSSMVKNELGQECSYKFSTIRAITAEPIIRRHARLFRKGKPVCRRVKEFKENESAKSTRRKIKPNYPMNLSCRRNIYTSHIRNKSKPITSDSAYRRLDKGNKQVTRLGVFSRRHNKNIKSKLL